MDIISIEDIPKKVTAILKNYAPQDVLLLFDVDLTLTVPEEPAVQIPFIEKYQDQLKLITSGLSEEQIFLLVSLATKKARQVLVEKKAPLVIKELQKKKIKIIALSSSITGSLGSIKRVEEWRYSVLKKLGICFDKTFSQITDLPITGIFSYRNQHPVYYRGVLCTNSPKKIKGKTLITFLKKINYSPKIIIFVDDQKENLAEVSESIKQYSTNIEFLGVEYKKGKQFTSGYVSEQAFFLYWENILSEIKQKNL